MAKRKQSKLLRTIISLFKHKLLLLRHATSSVHLTVLLATPHSPSLPSSCRLSAILSLGNSGPRPTAGACISTIMDRLHHTSSAHVALKCLIIIRHVIAHGSFILRDQLFFYPNCGGRNFLNLSDFRDGENNKTWELSNWVRFYSCYLETNLLACRKLGVFISSPDNRKFGYEIGSDSLSNWELMKEIEVLVGLIEEICKVPGSVFDYKSNLIHEILRLISEDYSHVQKLVVSRLSEFKDRVTELSRTELDELVGFVKKVEGCRARVSEVFGNKKRNEAFWEFLGETRGE